MEHVNNRKPPALAFFCLLILSATASAFADDTLATWIAPWDQADFTTLPACFAQVSPFALALSTASDVILAYPDLLNRAGKFRRPGTLRTPVVVNDVFKNGTLYTLKSVPALSKVLLDADRARRQIGQLRTIAADFDGVEIDYERIPPSLMGPFADFIGKLSETLRPAGKKLYIDLEPAAVDAHGDFERILPRLVASVDGIKLMAYYEHGGTSLRPAAGNSLQWVSDLAQKALRLIPREKLTVVLSLAGTEWTSSLPLSLGPWKGERLYYRAVMKRMSDSDAKIQWDDAAATPYFKDTDQRNKHEIWFENEASLSRKIRALKDAGVSHVGLWYWGKVHPDIKPLCDASR